MVGGGRHFGLGGLQKFLIAAVHQLGNLAADQISRPREYLHFAALGIFFDGGGDIGLFQKNAIVGGRGVEHVEAVVTEILHRIFVVAGFVGFNHHKLPFIPR